MTVLFSFLTASSNVREAGQAGTAKEGRQVLKREAQEGVENPHLKSAKIGATSTIGSVLVQKEEEEEEEEDEEDEEDEDAFRCSSLMTRDEAQGCVKCGNWKI